MLADPEKFRQESRFSPMFKAVREAFRDDALLPANEIGYVSASKAKLARTQDLRDLLTPEQVAALFNSNSAAWLSGDITQDKAPEIRQYVMRELDIDEIRPENFLPSLTKPFLETQSDEWVLQLYEFLSGQEKVLRRHLETVPFIRLDDGSHVVAFENGEAASRQRHQDFAAKRPNHWRVLVARHPIIVIPSRRCHPKPYYLHPIAPRSSASSSRRLGSARWSRLRCARTTRRTSLLKLSLTDAPRLSEISLVFPQ